MRNLTPTAVDVREGLRDLLSKSPNINININDNNHSATDHQHLLTETLQTSSIFFSILLLSSFFSSFLFLSSFLLSLPFFSHHSSLLLSFLSFPILLLFSKPSFFPSYPTSPLFSFLFYYFLPLPVLLLSFPRYCACRVIFSHPAVVKNKISLSLGFSCNFHTEPNCWFIVFY